MQARIRPYILAGGNGTRLWPLSRTAFPKQFLQLAAGGRQASLLQDTVQRLGCGMFLPPVVIGQAEHRFLIAEHMRQIGRGDVQVVLEPQARGTACAVLTAALMSDPQEMLLVLPCDHHLPDGEAFRRAVRAALADAAAGRMALFGVRPAAAHPGYGYMELDTARTSGGGWRVRRFVEKPDTVTAEAFVRGGRHVWNAGMVLARADVLLAAARRLVPQLLASCRRALQQAARDADFLRLAAVPPAAGEGVSFDHAVLEHAGDLACHLLPGEWHDVGSWQSVWSLLPHDACGNATSGDVMVQDVADSLVMQCPGGPLLCVTGLRDVVAVATADAVLLAPRRRSEQVRRLVARLAAAGREELHRHRRVYRPWGWFERLAAGERYQVKCLMILPGARLSLQSHRCRAEHWVVVRGTVRVRRGGEAFLLAENQSTYIPAGVRHRLENPGTRPAVLVEVQSGSYLGEDDIVRHEDDFSRERE